MAITPQQVVFILISVLTLGCGLMVVLSRNLFHSALWLVGSFFGVAALYGLLEAEFLAVAQILIYIGAIVVLFLFGVMLTRAPMREESGKLDNNQRLAGAVVSLFLFGVLTVFLIDAFEGSEIEFSDKLVKMGSTAEVGQSIFREYVIPFEVVSMLLLAALVGAVALARRD